MKIVQSFWSKPLFQSDQSLVDSRLNGGWPHRCLNYYSWALSCLQLRKFYDSVELVTDELGKQILIDQMKLPYTNVIVALNDIDNYDAGLWALGKIYTYALQKEPFLHVDGDVFISRQFEDPIVEAPLVAQNLEKSYPTFDGNYKVVWHSFTDRPVYFKTIYEQEFTCCSNAGILGGSDISFYHDFAREVFTFLGNNMEGIIQHGITADAGCVNVILEQVIFYWLAKQCDKEVTYLFCEEKGSPRLGFFQAAETNKHYVHCFGFFKNLRASYAHMEWKLSTDYPEYYKRITDLINSCEI